MATELAVTFCKQIGDSHKRCVDLSKQLEQIMIDQLAATRETGLLLKAAKDGLHPSEFNDLKKAVGLDSDAVRNYVTFAEKHREPVSQLREAIGCMKKTLLTSGLLENAPLKGHRVQPDYDQFWRYFSENVRNLIARWLEFSENGRRDLSEVEREHALAVLAPLLQIAKSLTAS
jgi:hypothetical protein